MRTRLVPLVEQHIIQRHSTWKGHLESLNRNEQREKEEKHLVTNNNKINVFHKTLFMLLFTGKYKLIIKMYIFNTNFIIKGIQRKLLMTKYFFNLPQNNDKKNATKLDLQLNSLDLLITI